MNAETLYLSGPMTGQADFNYPAFHLAAADLRQQGFTVLSPAESTRPEGSAWAEYMRDDIGLLLQAHGVATLDGWHTSRGASLEVFIAAQLGTLVMPVKDWLLSMPRAVS